MPPVQAILFHVVQLKTAQSANTHEENTDKKLRSSIFFFSLLSVLQICQLPTFSFILTSLTHTHKGTFKSHVRLVNLYLSLCSSLSLSLFTLLYLSIFLFSLNRSYKNSILTHCLSVFFFCVYFYFIFLVKLWQGPNSGPAHLARLPIRQAGKVVLSALEVCPLNKNKWQSGVTG